MAKRKLGTKRTPGIDGPAKKSAARKALGNASTTPGKKGSFVKGKRTAKKSGTS